VVNDYNIELVFVLAVRVVNGVLPFSKRLQFRRARLPTRCRLRSLWKNVFETKAYALQTCVCVCEMTTRRTSLPVRVHGKRDDRVRRLRTDRWVRLGPNHTFKTVRGGQGGRARARYIISVRFYY